VAFDKASLIVNAESKSTHDKVHHNVIVKTSLIILFQHCALVNNFGTTDETKLKLKQMGCISLKEKIEHKLNERNSQTDAFTDVDVPTESKRPKRVEKNEELDEEPQPSLIETVSMEKDSVESEGRLVKPSDQVLSGKNPAAAMLDFIPSKALKGMEDIVEEEEYYEKYTKITDVFIDKIPERKLDFPSHLDAFFFPSSVISKFPPPSKTIVGTYDYFCMDLASLLPVLALNIQPQEEILDVCAAPGTICTQILLSLKILFTLNSRNKRIHACFILD
jgi:hypothetical protein